VALWRPQYGPPVGAVAGLLRPPAAAGGQAEELAAVRVRGSGLAVTADVPRDAILHALVQPIRTGERRAVRFARTTEGGGGAGGGDGGVLVAAVPCAAAGGCRLVGFSVEAIGAGLPEVTVRELRQTGPAAVVLDRAAVADPTRWRPTVGEGELGPALATGPGAGDPDTPNGEARSAAGGLTIRLTRSPVPTVRASGNAFLVDAPVPLPVITAGELPVPVLAGDTRLRLASQEVPARTVAQARLLPLLGRGGSLVDLEYLDRLLPSADNEDMQVWLSADADGGLVDRLRDGGLTVLSDQTPAEASARYGNQGPALGLRFQLLVALLGALLAAGAVTVVAAVESPARAAELAALRAQGMRPRTVRVVALTGHLALVGVALVAGVVAAAVADAVTGATGSTFADRWGLLPVPDPGLLGLGLALAVPVVLIGGAATMAGVALTRAVRANGAGLR
jgi:hypothetical protein